MARRTASLMYNIYYVRWHSSRNSSISIAYNDRAAPASALSLSCSLSRWLGLPVLWYVLFAFCSFLLLCFCFYSIANNCRDIFLGKTHDQLATRFFLAAKPVGGCVSCSPKAPLSIAISSSVSASVSVSDFASVSVFVSVSVAVAIPSFTRPGHLKHRRICCRIVLGCLAAQRAAIKVFIMFAIIC